MTRSSSLRSWLMTSIAPGKRDELGREPPLGGQVEMVGGLVEHERVGAAEQDPDDVDPPALATRQRVDVVEQGVLAQPDRLRPDGRCRLRGCSRPRPGSAPRGRRSAAMASVVGSAATAAAGLVQLLVEDVEAPGRQHVGEPGGLEPETPGFGTWGRKPTVPWMSTSPATRRCGGTCPQMTETSDDLPVPLRPTRPTLSSGPTMNDASRSRVLPPISMVTSRPVIIVSHCTRFVSRGLNASRGGHATDGPGAGERSRTSTPEGTGT